MKLYKTIICPSCGQDHLLIAIDRASKNLYLSCPECMSSWWSMEDIKVPEKKFIDMDMDGDDPTFDEIKAHDWDKLIAGVTEID